jgi:hypothetical protein
LSQTRLARRNSRATANAVFSKLENAETGTGPGG